MPIDFGWGVPGGLGRMPVPAAAYEGHLRRVLELAQGRLHSLWVPDHFMAGQADVPEAMTTAAYLAALDPRIAVGTIVLGEGYRNPALVAKMAAWLQHLSGGRFVLGLGAGWKQDEYQAYGYDFPPPAVRIEQLAETIRVCRAMWDPAQPEATFVGRRHRIEAAVCQPKPAPPPPILLGGAGEKRMLALVAESADWWNLVGVSAEAYAHKLHVLEQHCARVGREPAAIRKTWMGDVSIAATHEEAVGLLQSYPKWPEDVALTGTPDEVGAQLAAYVDLGVDLFILRFADEPALAGMALFLEEVVPRFHRAV